MSTTTKNGTPGATFGGLVRSEYRKIVSTRLWWGMLLAAMAMTAFSAVFSAATAGLEGGFGGATAPLDSDPGIRNVYAASAFAGPYVFAAIMGITAMTGEYRYQTITPTFLVSPRRWPVVVAKFIANAVIGLVFGVAGAVTALLSGGAVIAIRGFDLGLATDDLWSSMGLAVLAVAIWALIGVGVGTLIRNQIAAILIVVLILFILEGLLAAGLVALDLDAAARLLPSVASSAMTSAASPFVELLDWWQGALVMLGYAAVFTGLGIALSLRRDVT